MTLLNEYNFARPHLCNGSYAFDSDNCDCSTYQIFAHITFFAFCSGLSSLNTIQSVLHGEMRVCPKFLDNATTLYLIKCNSVQFSSGRKPTDLHFATKIVYSLI